MNRKTYISLDENDYKNPKIIYVFGSNTQGKHGKGSAKIALDYFEARYGQASGLQGRSYAIITKDLTKNDHPSINEKVIIMQINELYDFARKNEELEFKIAYRGYGSNLNGYTSEEMADMFRRSSIPENIVFEDTFSKLVFNEKFG